MSHPCAYGALVGRYPLHLEEGQQAPPESSFIGAQLKFEDVFLSKRRSTSLSGSVHLDHPPNQNSEENFYTFTVKGFQHIATTPTPETPDF